MISQQQNFKLFGTRHSRFTTQYCNNWLFGSVREILNLTSLTALRELLDCIH
jgi:hypothetical protein